MPLRNLEQEKPTLEEDHAAVRRYLNQFRQLAFLNAQLVTIVIPNGTIYGKAYHSLERPYVGGFVVSASGYADTVLVVEPVTATALDCDVAREVLVLTGTAVSADTTVNVYLF